MNFNVGDRVIAMGLCDYNSSFIGAYGTVVVSNPDDKFYGVEWDEEFEDAHDLGGICEYHRGYWVNKKDDLVLLDEKISPRTKVERKCHKLWNNSKFVQKNKHLAY